jgi:hypothetical protein
MDALFTPRAKALLGEIVQKQYQIFDLTEEFKDILIASGFIVPHVTTYYDLLNNKPFFNALAQYLAVTLSKSPNDSRYGKPYISDFDLYHRMIKDKDFNDVKEWDASIRKRMRESRNRLKTFVINTRNRMLIDFGLDETPDIAGNARAKREADAQIVAKAQETMARASRAPPAVAPDDSTRTPIGATADDCEDGESTAEHKPPSGKRNRDEPVWTAVDLDALVGDEIGCSRPRTISAKVLDDVLILFPQLATGPIMMRYNATDRCVQVKDEAGAENLLYFIK